MARVVGFWCVEHMVVCTLSTYCLLGSLEVCKSSQDDTFYRQHTVACETLLSR